MIESIKISPNHIEIIDQTLLPGQFEYIKIYSCEEMIEAIKKLRIRGAPALGVAAAAAIYLAAQNNEDIIQSIKNVEESRPTAVNLFMACSYLKNEFLKSQCNFEKRAFDYMLHLMKYEKQASENMAENGLKEIGKNQSLGIITHCNAGALATYGEGTALAVIKKLAKHNDVIVYADETRPLLQGARLTMFELIEENVNAKLICDNMAGHLMQAGKINAVITGADRIAKNGDSANKIGTLQLAIMANYFNIPFYIVAPETTIDFNIETGKEIVIEERKEHEVKGFRTEVTAPVNCKVFNPAFDVTSSKLITAIITDKNIYKAPFNFSL